MTPEITALTCAALLHVAQFGLFSIVSGAELRRHSIDALDTIRIHNGGLVSVLSDRNARLYLSLTNSFEGLILFAVACVAVTLSNSSGALTTASAWTYVAARVIYIPCYTFGLNPWRSGVWTVGFAATTLMLLASLL